MILSLLSFLLVIAICVLSHEMGHYVSARMNGVQVHEFAFGMGPVLFQYGRGGNGTLWSVRAIPVGGFVRLAGMGEEQGEERTAPGGSFTEKDAWRRFIVLASGSAANIFLAIALTAVLLCGHGVIDLQSTRVGEVMKGYPAMESGIAAGDEIVSINGVHVENWSEMSENIRSMAPSGPLVLELQRPDKTVFSLRVDVPVDPEYGVPLLGIRPSMTRYTPVRAVFESFGFIWNFGLEILKGFYDWIAGTRDVDVTGPVGIASMAGHAAREGFWTFISFLALINLHLGIINLFPFPALDGGRMLLVAAEMITGRKLPEKWENYLHMAGFIALILLLLLITWNDIAGLLYGGR